MRLVITVSFHDEPHTSYALAGNVVHPAGHVSAVRIQKGDRVTPGEALIQIDI